MKFLQSILWPGGVYTDDTYTAKVKSMIPYYDEIMNHDYIGSLACMPNEPKTLKIPRELTTGIKQLQCIMYIYSKLFR